MKIRVKRLPDGMSPMLCEFLIDKEFSAEEKPDGGYAVLISSVQASLNRNSMTTEDRFNRAVGYHALRETGQLIFPKNCIELA